MGSGEKPEKKALSTKNLTAKLRLVVVVKPPCGRERARFNEHECETNTQKWTHLPTVRVLESDVCALVFSRNEVAPHNGTVHLERRGLDEAPLLGHELLLLK